MKRLSIQKYAGNAENAFINKRGRYRQVLTEEREKSQR